jgi:hypothetical protein
MKLNYRALLFTAAFIFKLPSPGLNKKEMSYAKTALLRAILRDRTYVDMCDYSFDIGYVERGWWTHPMAGIVGSFSYEFKGWSSEGDLLFDCWDTWNFNNTSSRLSITFPVYCLPILKQVCRFLRRYSWAKSVRAGVRLENKQTCAIQFFEKELMNLNSHEFTTKWSHSFNPSELVNDL